MNQNNFIYRLTVWCVQSEHKYPEFRICEDEVYYYHTKEEAVARIKEIGWRMENYCFVIEACPFGQEVFRRAYRRWVYDDEGDFISETLCSEFEDPKTHEQDEYFPGRRPDQCRFKPGDCVEVVFNDIVTLGIVMECPPTPEDVADKGIRCSRYNKPFAGKAEFEEDAYTILTGKIDEDKYSQYDETTKFSYTTNVLPPSLPIPPELKQQLEHLLTTVRYEIEFAKWDECILSPKDTGLEKMIAIRSNATTPKPVVYYLTPGNGALTVSIEKEPKRIRGKMDFVTADEFAKVKEWIKLNYDVLLSNWNDPDSVALISRQKPLSLSDSI